jgi:hypothetical protein
MTIDVNFFHTGETVCYIKIFFFFFFLFHASNLCLIPWSDYISAPFIILLSYARYMHLLENLTEGKC